MKKRMYKIMALAMTAAMVVPMAAQTTAFAADDKEITYWNIAVESPDKDIVTAAVDKFNKETKSGYTVNQVAIQNDTYKEKLVIAMSSGECPDMYSSWSGGPMYEYIDSGFAQPIDDLLTCFDEAVIFEFTGSCNCILEWFQSAITCCQRHEVHGTCPFGSISKCKRCNSVFF